MIGDYAAAAKQLNEDTALQSASFVVAAVDATAEREIGNKFDVSGYPTLKYLRYGKKAQDYDGGRKKKDLVDFMVKKMRMHRNELWWIILLEDLKSENLIKFMLWSI